MSNDLSEPITHLTIGNTFAYVLERRLNRRDVLSGGLQMASASVLSSLGLVGCGSDDPQAATLQVVPTLGFTAVGKSTLDRVAVPAGYNANVLLALGDPIKTGAAAYLNDGSDTGFDQRAGDHHDALYFFGLDASGNPSSTASNRGLLVNNHEAITHRFLHAAGTSPNPRPEAEALKEIQCHGVSVVEIAKNGAGQFQVAQNSTFNRRVTPMTEMEIHGPARNSKFMVTAFSPTGTRGRGTINNCANGYTPWGTYLTCEENWNGYFFRAAADNNLRNVADNNSLRRYGIISTNQTTTAKTSRHGWETVTPAAPTTEYSRWDCSVTGSSTDGSDDFRNEPNQFGWIVEIDPFDPTSVPRKRTAMGRFAHEGCWPGPLVPGLPMVFYMGDDSRYEYIYKFVSAANYDPDDTGLAAGDKYLNDGTLYVAKFNSDGTGEWIELAHGRNGLDADNLTYPFTGQAAVLVNARLAADVVGATKMDRPEWAAVHPQTGEVYFTLTNNSARGNGTVQTAPTNNYWEGALGADIPVDAANPRSYNASTGQTTSPGGNINGHIIRWREDGDRPDAIGFEWDIYLFGARSTYPAVSNVSGLSADNDFSSPDGLWFDDGGILWIQTDDGAYTDVTNCMLLAALPGGVGDGGPITLGTQATHIGAAANTNTLRRFLVGPKQCELTGICMTPDRRTMFVNIQHPGEGAETDTNPAVAVSHWPLSADATADAASGTARPRSATIAITRTDGGIIGL